MSRERDRESELKLKNIILQRWHFIVVGERERGLKLKLKNFDTDR